MAMVIFKAHVSSYFDSTYSQLCPRANPKRFQWLVAEFGVIVVDFQIFPHEKIEYQICFSLTKLIIFFYHSFLYCVLTLFKEKKKRKNKINEISLVSIILKSF